MSAPRVTSGRCRDTACSSMDAFRSNTDTGRLIKFLLLSIRESPFHSDPPGNPPTRASSRPTTGEL